MKNRKFSKGNHYNIFKWYTSLYLLETYMILTDHYEYYGRDPKVPINSNALDVVYKFYVDLKDMSVTFISDYPKLNPKSIYKFTIPRKREKRLNKHQQLWKRYYEK